MKNVMVGFLGVLFLWLPAGVQAADLVIAPPLFDLELQPRDIVTNDITIRNEGDSKIYVYATVNEIAVDDSGDIKEFITPVMDQRETSLTSWIQIERGRIEMMPGEERTVPLIVRVHPDAKTGEYHAFIGLVSESNRPLAEAKALRGDADGVILKVSIEDKTKDSLRLTSFLVDRFVVTEADAAITLGVKNEGAKVSQPNGELVFYNSRGEEVAAVPFNEAGEKIEPQTEKTFTVQIPLTSEIGRYKVNATIRYGSDGSQSVFDTAQFYLVPLSILLLVGVSITIFSFGITYLLRRVFYDELHSEYDHHDVPLRIRNDRDHKVHDHDIHITKT